MYLSEKSQSNVMLREKELDYKNKALEIETKLRQDAMVLEQKKLELQYKQIAMQFEMLRSFVANGSTKQNWKMHKIVKCFYNSWVLCIHFYCFSL